MRSSPSSHCLSCGWMVVRWYGLPAMRQTEISRAKRMFDWKKRWNVSMRWRFCRHLNAFPLIHWQIDGNAHWPDTWLAMIACQRCWIFKYGKTHRTRQHTTREINRDRKSIHVVFVQRFLRRAFYAEDFRCNWLVYLCNEEEKHDERYTTQLQKSNALIWEERPY